MRRPAERDPVLLEGGEGAHGEYSPERRTERPLCGGK